MTDIVERLERMAATGIYPREVSEAAAEIGRLRALLNVVRIWMKNIDRRESEVPLYNAICHALESNP